MADIRCPLCDRANSIDNEFCQFCGARLRAPASLDGKDTVLRPGEEPVRKPTSEFERVSPSLRTSRPLQAGEEPTKKDTAELEQALPAWLRAARRAGEPVPEETSSELPADSQAAAGEEEQLPPWLAELEKEQAAEPAEVPDWLAGLAAQGEQEEEIPDWLASLRGGGSGTAAEAEAFSEESLSGTEPWTGETFVEETALPLPEETVSPGKSAAEPPAIFGEAIGEGEMVSEPPPAFVEEAGAGEVTAEVPDWLASRSGEGAVETPPAFVEEAGAGEVTAEVPDWLASLPGEGAVETPPAFVEEAGAGEVTAEVPDWLASLPGEGAVAVPPVFGEETGEAAEMPAWLQTPGGEIAAGPAWAAEEPSWSAERESGAEETPSVPPLIGTEGEIESAAAFGIETPDWLSAVRPEEGTLGTEAPAEEIAPAELPDWVRAMRPLEAAVEEAASAIMEETPTETRGLLAGLRGVLPPIGDLGPMRKPSAPPAKLQVSEGHQALATQLEEMVAAEETPRSQIGSPAGGVPVFWRWVITAILLVAAIFPAMVGAPASFALTPPSQGILMQTVDQIPANSPVAVAFDYEAGLSGDVEAAAAALLDHLLQNSPRLTLVSTLPTGPVLAERFMQSVMAHHHYQSGQQYLILGYIPGGAAGILAFASNPRSVGSSALWQSPVLADVTNLSDYAALIILTDSPDVGRMWIEQAKPYLGNKPLILVISAQAEPLIQPYYDAGQIQGIVTGLAGGKAYEQALPASSTTLAGQRWGGFGAMLLAAALLMIAGGIWSAFLGRRERISINPGRGS